MSREIQLSHRCPHLTIEERVFLGADRRSLPTVQPVGADSSVRILVNNEIPIPRYGLFSQAQLHSTLSGPYRIVANETSFTVRSNTETVSLSLAPGTRVETSTLVQQINTASESILAENIRGHLVLSETAAFDRDSVLAVSGTAAASLGFEFQKRAQGKRVFPGWELAPRTDPVMTNRYPRFVSAVSQNPVFKVTYTAPQRRCLRCGGSRIENDYRFDSQGAMLLVQNEDLLHQVALKILLTSKGSNPFHQWYGTALKSRIGSKAIGIVASLINEDVRRALENQQRLQVEQAKYQNVSFRERIAAIESVRTFPLDTDPTTFLIEVYVRNASREPINLSVIFTVPTVISLNGDGFGNGGV